MFLLPYLFNTVYISIDSWIFALHAGLQFSDYFLSLILTDLNGILPIGDFPCLTNLPACLGGGASPESVRSTPDSECIVASCLELLDSGFLGSNIGPSHHIWLIYRKSISDDTLLFNNLPLLPIVS